MNKPRKTSSHNRQQSKQRQALTRHWMKAQPVVSAFISASVIDFHHSEDLLQEVAEVVAGKFEEYDESRSFTGWALGIARIRVLKYYRRRGREKELYTAENLSDIAAAFVRIESKLNPMGEALHHCLKQLKPRQKEALELRYVHDLNLTEIATKMDMKKNALAVMLHRVRDALAKCVNWRISTVETPSK